MLYQLVLHLSFIMLVFIHLFGKIKEAFNCDLLASLDFLMFEWVIQYDRKDLLRGQPTMTECHIRCLENLVMLSDRFANSANFLLMTSLMKMMYIFLMDMNLLLFFCVFANISLNFKHPQESVAMHYSYTERSILTFTMFSCFSYKWLQTISSVPKSKRGEEKHTFGGAFSTMAFFKVLGTCMSCTLPLKGSCVGYQRR
jgi:hypothetical protein